MTTFDSATLMFSKLSRDAGVHRLGLLGWRGARKGHKSKVMMPYSDFASPYL